MFPPQPHQSDRLMARVPRFREKRKSPRLLRGLVTDRRLAEINSYFMSFLASLIVAAASSALLFSASISSGMCCNALIRT